MATVISLRDTLPLIVILLLPHTLDVVSYLDRNMIRNKENRPFRATVFSSRDTLSVIIVLLPPLSLLSMSSATLIQI